MKKVDISLIEDPPLFVARVSCEDFGPLACKGTSYRFDLEFAGDDVPLPCAMRVDFVGSLGTRRGSLFACVGLNDYRRPVFFTRDFGSLYHDVFLRIHRWRSDGVSFDMCHFIELRFPEKLMHYDLYKGECVA